MFSFLINISTKSVEHQRKVYDILSLMGDIGGVIEILILLTAAFIGPINEHLFNLKAIQKLYLARTRQQNLFNVKLNKKQVKKRKEVSKVIKSMDS